MGEKQVKVTMVQIPNSFSLSVNLKGFSNTEESVKLLNEIVIPYVTPTGKNLGLHLSY